MTVKDTINIRAAIGMVRKSESLWFHLQVSISSVSSEHELVGINLEDYLSSSRRRLYYLLIKESFKVVFKWLLRSTLFVLCKRWPRVTGSPEPTGE